MMHLDFLEFEQPIAELEAKIEALRMVGNNSEIDLQAEIKKLQKKSAELTRQVFSNLVPWQVVQLARHPKRPYMMDYVSALFTEVEELHGDRHYSDDLAIVGGLARFEGTPVMVIGHQKGRNTKEKVVRNFGMPRPEAYRKALRLMQLAEKFNLPVITFIDTPGAYPGIGAEERNQSEAIARNLFEMAQLNTPIICLVMGEGGSGGALAIGVGDRIAMMQYSIYSVISPEGCASILWKSAVHAPEAAAAMGVAAHQILELGLIDAVIPEPLGGAHRNIDAAAASVKQYLSAELPKLMRMPRTQLLAERYQRFRQIGA